ncbi:hypothetical protein AKJ09_05736 [Labilithrix luteola]|uniref:Lipoprotein n=1 Tax=Labilithrix luteola TaxID=1391654 RepID=A0A0K1PZZ8_9BACT|nr:hypothetical protein [Labilithrix luteola]AKU99072.1 hypothetical protein AKJ09_05736 [Labilithrix luteola]
MKWISIGLGALVMSGMGCTSSNDDGTLQQNWTIAGTTNPTACGPATQMRVVVVDPAGATAATRFAACSSFQTNIDLAPNNYTGAATFLDANGAAVSRTLVIPPFTINHDNTTFRTVDFALTDFLAR